jgi:hypothetical protein
MIKAQSAIEYLTTYGWMLVVVAISSGIVFSAVEPSCSNSVTGLLGTSFAVENVGTLADSEGIALQIRNDREDRVEINKFRFEQDNKTYIYEANESMRPGSVEGFSIPGFVSSESCNTIEMEIIHSIGPEGQQLSGQQVTAELKSQIELGNLDAPPAPTSLSANYTGESHDPSTEPTTQTLTWDNADLDQGLDNGVVHESTANTSYSDASVIRKGDSVSDPLFNDSLVAWYPLQESSGSTAFDFSGNNYDGTINGVTPGSGTNLADLPTYSFDQNDDSIVVQNDPDITSNGNGGMTISMWYKASSRPGSGHNIVSKRDDASTTWILYQTPDGMTWYYNGQYQRDSNTYFATGDWEHITGVYDPSNSEVRLYKNGNLATTTTASGLSSDNADLKIGQDNTLNSFKGDISDVRIYDRALNLTEIDKVYGVFGSNSSHETVYKGSSVDSSPSINFTSVNIPAGSNATLKVLEDNNTDGSVDNTDTIVLNDSDVDYSASGLSGSGELSLNVTLFNSDLTVGSSVEVPVNVTGEN